MQQVDAIHAGGDNGDRGGVWVIVVAVGIRYGACKRVQVFQKLANPNGACGRRGGRTPKFSW
jgi:hypothetical protein